MKKPIITATGTSQGTVDLPDQLFATKINKTILAQYLRVYLARQRQNTKHSQTRATITGSTAKVWRQKGTGRARHGSRKAPIFVGGSKAHGPTGQENYSLKITKKLKRIALTSALTSKVDNIIITTALDKPSDKTKPTLATLEKILSSKFKKATIVLADSSSPLIKATSNLDSVTTTQASRINPYEVVNSNHLIFSKLSLQLLKDTFLKNPKKPSIDRPKSTSKKIQTGSKSTKA